MQFQADLLDAQVLRPRCIETTALGAAYLAGLAVGYWQDLDEIRAVWALEQDFTPAMTPEARQTHLEGCGALSPAPAAGAPRKPRSRRNGAQTPKYSLPQNKSVLRQALLSVSKINF